MGKYGEAAVRTAELLRSGEASAVDAWSVIAADLFHDAPEARKKGCPREAFFGLCQAELIRGVSRNACNLPERSSLNRQYAVAAARLLQTEPQLASGSEAELWRRVMDEVRSDPEKRHNFQMDVVLSLWEQDLIAES